MNMSKVLGWAKANIVTVIFLIVMLVAVVALPLVAGKMNQSVKTQMEERIAKKRTLESLKKTQYEVKSPGLLTPVIGSGVVNEPFVVAFKALVGQEQGDASGVLAAALDHNCKGRGVLMPELFPDPPDRMREVLPGQFAERLVAAYDQLLADLNVGAPADSAEMVATIERHRRSFLSSGLQKEEGDALTDDEEQKLHEYLAGVRIGEYRERAGEISFYVDKNVLAVPVYDHTVEYPMFELFRWQWDFWVVQDLLFGLADANMSDQVARLAPVKRVVELFLFDIDAAPEAAPSRGGGGGQSGFGFGTEEPSGNSSGDAAPTGVSADPKRPVATDYGISITGRATNPLYDVRVVELVLVVETARIPEVLDALAKRNFISVLDLGVRPRDAFADASAGYYYGSKSVSELTLQLETVWMRQWTSEFMPASVKQALGVPAQTAPGAPGEDPGA